MLGQCAEDSSESSNTLKTLMISYQWSGITLTNHGFLCSYFWYMSSLIRSTSRSRALIHINTALQWGDPATHSVHSINLIIRTWTWTNILLMERIVSTYLGCSTTLCLTSPYWLLIFIKFYRNIMSFISFTTLLFSRVFIRTCWQVEDRDGTEVDLPVTDELTERRLCSVVSQPVSVIRPLSGPNNWACAGVSSSPVTEERRGDKRHSAGVSRQASSSNWCTFNHSDQLRKLMEKIMGILTMMMKCLPVPWDWNLSVLVNVRIRRVM